VLRKLDGGGITVACATAILLAALAAPVSNPAEARWVRLHSPNFELYTSAGARNARDTLKEFERVRSFFLQAFKGPMGNPSPVRLVAFGSIKEYEPYRLNSFADAYYQQTPDRDYIVMSHGGADTFPIAVHEYVHLLVRHSGMKLPPWLNEGIAELYSTLKPLGDKILVGDLIPGRHRALLQEKWVPLDVILSADHNSPYYNEKNKAGNLYNEGWALTHMLFFREEYRPQFSQLIALINSGMPSAEAIGKVYGRSVAVLEKDLQGYLRGTSFRGALVSAKLEKNTDELPMEPLQEFDVSLMFADLSSGPGKDKDVQAKLEALVKLDPKRPEPYRKLAYLAWHGGHNDEAVKDFAKAYELGDRDPALLWDYGRLSERRSPADAVRVLGELVAKDPDRQEARLELAEAQLRADQAAAALATVEPVRKLTPENAAQYFRVVVYAYLRTGDQKRALSAAERFKSISKTDEQRQEAERLVSQSTPRQGPVPRMPQGSSADVEAPTLRRTEVVTGTKPDEPPPPPPPSASGRFVQLDCREGQAQMVIEVNGAREVYLIEDPGKITITTGGRGTVDLACGPQKQPVTVKVEYRPSGQPGIKGVIRTLAFE
jgi:Tfp pilus assembly protein PilF